MSPVGTTARDADALLLELALHSRRRPLRDPDDTSQRILRAAIELFAVHGYGGTSMRDIARAVGIRPASIYAHFTSKEQVLAEALSETLEAFHAFLLDAVRGGRAPREQLEQLVRQHVRWQVRYLRVAGSWDMLWEMEAGGGNLEAARRAEIAERRAIYHALVEALVAAVRPDVDAGCRSRAILALCDRAPAWAAPADPAAPDDAIVEAAWSTIERLLA